MTTILGIDPGYDRVGWAVFRVSTQPLQVVDFGCIQTSKKDTTLYRYQCIQEQLRALCAQQHPSEAGVETLFFSKNQKTALQVAEARGVIIGELLHAGCEIVDYHPLTIKQTITGTGSADKAAVEKMVRLQLGAQITARAVVDDAMDALAIGMTHAILRKKR